MMKLQFLSNVKVFIFDIGKTLFDKSCQKKCSIKTLSALNLLKKSGYKVGVCTMRTFDHIKEIIDFEFDFYILNNGAYVLCENEVVVDSSIKINSLEINNLTYTPFKSYYSTFEAKNIAINNGFIADEEGISSEIYNLILFNISTLKLRKFKKEFNCYYWKDSKICSIQNKNTSRITAINKICELYHIKLENILYFGDGPNDLEVFKNIPKSIAMGNCYPELIKYCVLQIDPCKDDGIANFIFENYQNE